MANVKRNVWKIKSFAFLFTFDFTQKFKQA